MFTRKQLDSFIAERNTSPIHTNLQFQIDAKGCGITLADLGKAEELGPRHYVWATPYGSLVERDGILSLE